MKSSEPGAQERPVAFPPLFELLARPADLEEHARLVAPPGVLALEEVPEEPLLQADAIVGVEMGPVLDAVHLEPLLSRSRAQEALEVAARVQPLAAPVGGREERDFDLGEVGQARPPVLVARERVAQAILVEVAARRSELLFGQGLGSGNPLAGHAAAIAARAHSVLHADHLRGEPRASKSAEDAAVPTEIAVVVRRPFPDAHRGE